MIERLLNGVMLRGRPGQVQRYPAGAGRRGFNHWYHCVVMEAATARCAGCGNPGVGGQPPQAGAFRPVFLTSELTMGRYREMDQREIDILSEEVGLKPVALPGMTTSAREGRTPAAQAGPSAGAAAIRKPGASVRRGAGRRKCRSSRAGFASRARSGRAPSARGASRALRLPSGPASNRKPRPASRATSVRPARRATSRRPASRRSSGGRNGRRRYASGLPPLSGKRPGKALRGPFHAWESVSMVARTQGG